MAMRPVVIAASDYEYYEGLPAVLNKTPKNNRMVQG